MGTDVKFKTEMTFFGIFKKIAGIWNMVLIKILSYLLDIENSKISSTFDVDIWNQNNPDFYVPPHPILYLLTFNIPYFITISTANVIFPETISHLFYIGFMVTSLVFEFVTGIFFAGGLGNFWIIVFLAMDIVKKWFDWKAVVKLLSTTHVILGTWPLVRPDFFQSIEDLYCAYWSC